MVCHLIQNGADVNSANTVRGHDSASAAPVHAILTNCMWHWCQFGVTPLHAAARSGDKQVVQKLLDSGSVPVKDSVRVVVAALAHVCVLTETAVAGASGLCSCEARKTTRPLTVPWKKATQTSSPC